VLTAKSKFWGYVKMTKWMAVFFGVLSIALLTPAGLRAQAGATGATGAITGTVLDPKGGSNQTDAN
jgi:hypothetical protein